MDRLPLDDRGPHKGLGVKGPLDELPLIFIRGNAPKIGGSAWRYCDCADFVVIALLALLPRLEKPPTVMTGNVGGHIAAWNHVVPKGQRRPGLWNARQDPEERLAKLSFSLQAYAAGLGSGHEGLDLNVHESCTRTIAAKDVSIRRVSEC